MKKIITLLLVVVAISTITYAQKREVNTISMENLSLKQLNYRTVSEEETVALMPEAFKTCCEVPDGLLVYQEKAGGFAFGSNYYGDIGIGQIFKESKTNTVISVDVFLSKDKDGDNEDLNVKLYTLNSQGLPNELIATSTPVSTSNLTAGSLMKVTFIFADPVEVPANFVATINVPKYSSTSSNIGIASSEEGCYNEEDGRRILSYSYLNETTQGWTCILDLYEGLTDGWIEFAIFPNVIADEEQVDLNSYTDRTFTISPNPTTDVVYIENAVNSNVRIVDMTGKVVVERNITSANEALEVSHLENGIYFVEVIGADNNKSAQKLIKR